MRQSKIERNILEKEAKNFVSMLDAIQEQSLVTRQSTRQSHYDKNYKKY